jgi:hypothetical protein
LPRGWLREKLTVRTAKEVVEKLWPLLDVA